MMAIQIYSKTNCSQCITAKQWLGKHYPQRQTDELFLEKDFDREALFATFPQAKSYPQFAIDGQPIGNFSDLQAHLIFEPSNF